VGSAGRIVSIIDVGSNSVRLLVARQINDAAFEVVDEERYPARLGQGQLDGYLSRSGIERGLRAMRICAEVAASYGPIATVAVGTEAIRRAPNAYELIDAVARETGLRIRTLSAEEEAHASFLGAVNSTQLRDGYVVDVGGGSLEVVTVERRSLVAAKSVPFGALYASERYLKSDPPAAKDVRALRKAVRQAIGPLPARPALVGLGGAVRNLARMQRLKSGYPLRRLHGFTVSRLDLHRLALSLCATDADGRRKMAGVSMNRLDSLPAAAIVLDEVLDLAGASDLQVAGQGLREGLLWQELRGEGAIVPDVRAASIAGLAEANGMSVLRAEPVVSVAGQLFAATQPIHGYGPPDLDLLLSGARLAGIGMHVDYYSRDRHAEYLVHSGDLHGFTHREIVLLAALVRAAEGGGVALTDYARILGAGDERRAAVLGALLGAARAVRRRTPSPVLDCSASLNGGGLSIKLAGSAPLDAEVYALEKQQRSLSATLGVPVTIATAGA
jgi:exopolyphosphatase/guanosine-5'-triphosphate,3'-diphosphate pyrophosphatase